MKKTKRKYSLYEKIDRKWVRVSDFSYPLQTARRVYQSSLLAAAMGYSPNPKRLRPVEEIPAYSSLKPVLPWEV